MGFANSTKKWQILNSTKNHDTKYYAGADVTVDRKDIKEIVKEKNLVSNIEFKGWINRNEIPEYLSNASIGIGPLKRTTVTENALPIKVLEYMASSLPIIAKTGTLPDDVLIDNENGWFVENSSELSEKIIKLEQNPELVEKMGKNSLNMVQKFSWERIVKSIIDIYEKF